MVTAIAADVYATGNGTALTTQLKWPTGITAGDRLYLICVHNNGTAITSGTGITVPSGWTQEGTDHVYSSSMAVRVWRKDADGSETAGAGIPVQWGGGSSTSRSFWVIVAQPANRVFQGIAWADQAGLTTPSVDVPTYSHTGNDEWFTLGFERGSSPSTAYTTTPTGATVLEQMFGTSSGACSGAIAVGDTLDTDGTVGQGSWVTNTSGSAGRVAMTVVASVPAALTRVYKNATLSYDTKGRGSRNGSVSYDVAGSGTRVYKNATLSYNTKARTTVSKTLSYNIASPLSEAGWPAFIGHRGADPGPEETDYAYEALFVKGAGFWHEGDLQLLSDGTLVASHDDDVDRLYSTGPYPSGNITAMTQAQWDATFWRVNSGYTGADRQAMRISQWITRNGPGSGRQTIGIWEVKTGTPVASATAAFSSMKGQVVLNCSTLAECQAVVAAGFDTCFQTNTPNFTDFTANGIKYLSISYTSMNSTIAAQAEAAGVKVLMYTVNSTANRDSMLALFSSPTKAGFITNKPATIATGSRVTKTATLSYNTLARAATKTATLSYNALARGTKTGTVSYDTRFRGTRNGSLTYDVAGIGSRVYKNATLSYDTKTRGSVSKTLSYDSRARGTTSRTLSFNTRARGQRNGTLSYNTMSEAAVSGIELWFSNGATMIRVGQVVT